jgi:hypothetical protein
MIVRDASSPGGFNDLRVIERAAARNLVDYVHAVQQVGPAIGAGCVQCAGGIGAFVGIRSPLTTVKGAGPEVSDDDLDTAEAFFARCGVGRITLELAPWISGATIERLTRRGYTVDDAEDVVIRRRPFDVAPARALVMPVDSVDWPAVMLRMNGEPSSSEWRVLVEAAAILPGATRFGVMDDDNWISCAQIMPAGSVAIFGNDATLASARGRGAQTATIQEHLRSMSSGAFACVMAEVAAGSTSERNYLRNGFQIAYARSHYVRKIVA